MRIFILTIAAAALCCGPCHNHAEAGPLKRLLNRGGGGDPVDSVDPYCTDCTNPTARSPNIHLGRNQSIVGEVPRHLWPNQPTVTTAADPYNPAAPVADNVITVTAAPAPTVQLPADVEEAAIRESLANVSKALAEINAQVTAMEATATTPLTPTPAAPAVSRPVTITTTAVEASVVSTDHRLDRLTNAVEKLTGTQVDEPKPGEASALVRKLPTVELSVIDPVSGNRETVSLDLPGYVIKELTGNEPPAESNE